MATVSFSSACARRREISFGKSKPMHDGSLDAKRPDHGADGVDPHIRLAL
jgi:hypothetical protein